MTSPKISVVIPCFNLGRYLEEAVDSVFDQTFQDFEIVIVNDGSTDDETNRLLADYRRPNTRVLTTANRGLAAARNLGIWSTRGPYICALDADDRLERTYLAKAAWILDMDSSVSFVSSWLRTFGDEDWLWKQDRCDLVALLAECTVCTAALVRRAAVEAVRGFDERMPLQGYEDWDLWISLVEQGFRGTIIPEALFFYRRRAGSMSSVCCEGEGHLELMKYLLEKHERSYRENLREVLRMKDDAVSEVLRTNYELERNLHGWLIPEVARRSEELTVLERRLRDAETERDLRAGNERLTVELDRERREAASLRSALLDAHQGIAQVMRSRSWRFTAPLRAVHEWLARAAESAQTAEMNERVAEVVQALRPLGRSRFEWGHFRRLSPISPEWGADRGRRIDCYYIEQFLQSNAHDITGAVLEVHDDDYTARFGGSRVTRSDVVDIDETNRRATVFADLRRADAIPSHTYDCFIMTQTLHVFDDMRRVLAETARILKPGGILLATLPCASRIAPKQGLDGDFWRFTAAAARRLFAGFYPAENLIVTSHGNVLVTIAYLYGLACEELRPEEFEVHDPYFPLIVSVRAKNAGGREEGSVVPDWSREPHILT